MRSKTKCILNTFISWLYYRKGKLKDLAKMDQLEVERIRNKLCPGRGPFRINDMDKIMKHNKRILTSLDSLGSLTVEDTIENCVYYYDNGHCYLVVHESKAGLKRTNTTISSMCYKRHSYASGEYYTMDIESYRDYQKGNNVHVPLLVGVYSETERGEEFKQFYGEDAIYQTIGWLCSKRSDCTIWAHNGGKYDWHFLFDHLSDFVDVNLVEPVRICDLDGALIQIRCHLVNGHKLVFKDSYRLLPASLDRLVQDFNTQHRKLNMPIKHATRDELLHSPRIHEYNRLDCIALYEVLKEYKTIIVNALDVDPLSYSSAASLAKAIYFSKYYDNLPGPSSKQKYLIFSPSRTTHEFIERAYVGGRNELFKRGVVNGPLYVYDFTSLYPEAGTMMLPYGQPKYLGKLRVSAERMDSFLVANPGFYEVTIASPTDSFRNENTSTKNHIPLHGVMSKGRLVFPIFSEQSHKTTVLFSEEIRKGLTLGYKYNIINGYTFSLGPIMKDCFEDLFSLRRKAIDAGQLALAHAVKITINSLYGFNGFRKYNRTVLKVYGKDYEDHLVAKELLGKVSYKKYGNLFLAEEKINIHSENTSIAIAAAITSYARMILYELMCDLRDIGANVYYVDTDSVITDYCMEGVLKQKYMPSNGKQMGELRQIDEASEAIFIACKTYGYITDCQERVKAKGSTDCTYDTLRSLVHHPVETYVPTMFANRKSKIRDNVAVYDKIQKRVLSGAYHKGTVLEDGTIVPLTF